MDERDLGAFREFSELDDDVFDYLFVTAYNTGVLPEFEDLVFSFQYGIYDGEPPARFQGIILSVEEISEALRLFYEIDESPERVASIVERAEAKMAAAIWSLIAQAVRRYFEI